MPKPLIIVGAGGFGVEALWVAEEMNRATTARPWTILGFADDHWRPDAGDVYGYRVLGTPEAVATAMAGQQVGFHCAIGDNSSRAAVAARLDALGWSAATLVHPSVICARDVTIGKGVYIGALSILSPLCQVGDHVLINQRVAVGHHSKIGSYAQLCPGSQINGGCQIGEGALIGSNASICPTGKVGRYAVVAANSMVLRSVGDHKSVIGVPARVFQDLTPSKPQSTG